MSPTTQIDNPTSAFGQLTTAPGSVGPGVQYVDVENTGASAVIPAGAWVAVDVTGSGTHICGVILGAHGGVLHDVIGIAMDTIKVGAVGRVCTFGPIIALGSTAGISAGDAVTGSTASTDDGCVMTASTPLVGQIIGIALAASAAVVKTPVPVWVRSA